MERMDTGKAKDEAPVNLLALGKLLLQEPFPIDSLAVRSADLSLSADGGGIRGVSELLILHEIMTRLQHDLKLNDVPRPCDFFHLIGGTSTGG